MSESKNRKPVFQDYYTDEDYADVMLQLPGIIKDAEKKAGEVIEPTIYEKREIMAEIKNFIRENHRKVYGGTALNEAIKLVNPDDAFYDDTVFSDIEFYSTTPIPDLVDLCNILHEKGYKYVVGNEAQHEETFTIFVNFQVYCDITFVLPKVYNGIKTMTIDGIDYVDPHFMLIDYLRMINQPLTAAAQRWEKAFKRMFILLKNYPFEYFDKQIKIKKPVNEIQTYMDRIKKDFITDEAVQKTCLIMGFDAYNFYIRYAMGDRSVEKMARTTYNPDKLEKMIVNVPYMEFITVSYRDTVEKFYNFFRTIVADPKLITFDEYFPLFQFTNYSVVINYRGMPVAKFYEGDGFCIPNVKTSRNYMYVSYQYILMYMLINKFNSFLDKDREMYFNYGIAISNLVDARNIFLTKKNIGVINNTPFGEFRVNCVGSTVSFSREGRLRNIEKNKLGKKPFRYQPESFFGSSAESQAKFDPKRFGFKNTSGNKIMVEKNILFKFDADGNIIKDSPPKESNTEQERITSDKTTENPIETSTEPSTETSIKPSTEPSIEPLTDLSINDNLDETETESDNLSDILSETN